jgi:conjugative transfer signal peptidase TraF
MSRRRAWLIATTLAAGGFALTFAAAAFLSPHPRLVWNASASAPIGLYRIVATTQPARGELVVIAPPPELATFMARRRYLPLGVPLRQHVAAGPGARVCRSGARVTVDGQLVAIARARDGQGRPLPVWRGCRVVAGHQLFLLNAPADSFDGRYFGPVPDTGLIGRAVPVFIRDVPADAPAPPLTPSLTPRPGPQSGAGRRADPASSSP